MPASPIMSCVDIPMAAKAPSRLKKPKHKLKKMNASVSQTTYPNHWMFGFTTFSMNAPFAAWAKPMGMLSSGPPLPRMMSAENSSLGSSA